LDGSDEAARYCFDENFAVTLTGNEFDLAVLKIAACRHSIVPGNPCCVKRDGEERVNVHATRPVQILTEGAVDRSSSGRIAIMAALLRCRCPQTTLEQSNERT